MIADVDFRLFLITAPDGKHVRTGVWNGRRDYSNQPSNELLDLVGGPHLHLVQVGRPTNGFEGRSSVELTHVIAKTGDGVSVVHWARGGIVQRWD